jgi:hypothetical protein
MNMKILLKIGKGILVAPLAVLLAIGMIILVAIVLSVLLPFHIINLPIRAVRYWLATRKLGKLSHCIVVIYSAKGKWKSYTDHYRMIHPQSEVTFIDISNTDTAHSAVELIKVAGFVRREFKQIVAGDTAYIAKFGLVPLWGTRSKVLGNDRSLAVTIKEYSV